MDEGRPPIAVHLQVTIRLVHSSKALMALVALQEGTLVADQGYPCGGGYRMSGHTVGCHKPCYTF